MGIISTIVCLCGRNRNQKARVLLADGRIFFYHFGDTVPVWRIRQFLVPAMIHKDINKTKRGNEK